MWQEPLQGINCKIPCPLLLLLGVVQEPPFKVSEVKAAPLLSSSWDRAKVLSANLLNMSFLS